VLGTRQRAPLADQSKNVPTLGQPPTAGNQTGTGELEEDDDVVPEPPSSQVVESSTSSVTSSPIRTRSGTPRGSGAKQG
jgi:hypothetical protein